MLFRDELAVYCENHMEHNNTLCGQNSESQYVKSCGKYSDYWALKGWYRFNKALNYLWINLRAWMARSLQNGTWI
jgi:hypothetical protein